jgi:hypothetical protein
MQFHTPRGDRVFEIPDEWWQFAEMDRLSRNGRRFFTYDGERYASAQGIALDEIEPPQRSEGVQLLQKSKLVPVLMATERGPPTQAPAWPLNAVIPLTYHPMPDIA